MRYDNRIMMNCDTTNYDASVTASEVTVFAIFLSVIMPTSAPETSVKTA